MVLSAPGGGAGIFRFAALALAAGLAAGCVLSPAPYRPLSWPQHALRAPETADVGEGQLQVLVTYGGLMSSHSAVRVVGTDGRVVFWDPAGDYGRLNLELDPAYAPFPLDVTRTRDLVVDPPDIETYVRFRWALSDTAVEVFEWDLTAGEAHRLQEVLLHGRDPDKPGTSLYTTVMPPLCTVATSRFLRRFGPPTLALSGTYFFPHHLAEALYHQSPARVLVFLRTEWPGVSSLVPPARKTGLLGVPPPTR